jgi:hypothetical protein
MRSIVFLLSLFMLLMAGAGSAQTGLRLANPYSVPTDSATFPVKQSILPIEQFNADQIRRNQLKLNFEAENKMGEYYSPENVMPASPFELDTRETSNYVPRMVRDRITTIMNRPKDSAFTPILGVAFLAAKLAAKHLQIEQRIELHPENLAIAADLFQPLAQLLLKSPQTAEQLFLLPGLNQDRTMVVLQRQIDLLTENKLVRRKLIDKGSTQYFPAFTLNEIQQACDHALSDTSLTAPHKKAVQKLMQKLAKLKATGEE